MKNRLLRLCRTLHAWGGLTLALLMLLVSVTGTLLIWKDEYLRLALPQAAQPFTPTPQALAQIASKVEARLGGDQIVLIEFAREDFALTKVLLSDSGLAYFDTQGEMIGRWALHERWEDWLYDLHHRLLLDNLGLTIVGLSALAMIILVLAGLAAFWPLRRGWRQGLWPHTPTRPHLLRSHRNLGVVEALPLLLTLVTGVILAFPDEAEKVLLEPFRDDNYSMDFAEHLDGVSGDHSGDWLPVMQRSLQTFPGAVIRSARVPNGSSPYRIIGLQQPGEFNPQGLSQVWIEAQGGNMDIRIDSQAQHLSERMVKASYALHAGRLGLWYKLLLTLSGLAVAMLSVLGMVSFLKPRV